MALKSVSDLLELIDPVDPDRVIPTPYPGIYELWWLEPAPAGEVLLLDEIPGITMLAQDGRKYPGSDHDALYVSILVAAWTA